MKFVYNPLETGAPIKDWHFNFVKYEHSVGKIIQYEDKVAEAILANYGFLQDLSRSDVDRVLAEQKKKQFTCKYCHFSSDAEIGLISHMRKHADEIKNEEQPLDPAIVPLATGEVTNPIARNSVIDETESSSFYGPGFQEH